MIFIFKILQDIYNIDENKDNIVNALIQFLFELLK